MNGWAVRVAWFFLAVVIPTSAWAARSEVPQTHDSWVEVARAAAMTSTSDRTDLLIFIQEHLRHALPLAEFESILKTLEFVLARPLGTPQENESAYTIIVNLAAHSAVSYQEQAKIDSAFNQLLDKMAKSDVGQTSSYDNLLVSVVRAYVDRRNYPEIFGYRRLAVNPLQIFYLREALINATERNRGRPPEQRGIDGIELTPAKGLCVLFFRHRNHSLRFDESHDEKTHTYRF